MKNKSSIFLVFIFCLVFFQAKAQQNNIKFVRISVEEGLSQSSAFAITQDKLGYIWIGTFDGLNRYDGYDIKVFKNDPNDEYSLSDNYIQNLCIDNYGKLWIGTNSRGLCIYDNIQNQFNAIPIKGEKSEKGLEGNSVLALKKIDNNTLVALTEKSINLVNVNTLKCTQISSDEYAKIENAPSLLSYFNKTVVSDKKINCSLNDTKGDGWMGTDNGLERKRKGFSHLNTYTNELYDPFSLSSNEITCLMEDRGGVIWVGTSLGGVCKWDRQHEDLLLYRNNPSNAKSISSSKVRCFYEDSKNRIWIGTVGNGLNLWDREKDEFTFWNTKSKVGLSSDKIRDIVEWNGKYVIATDGGGIQTFNPDKSALEFTDLHANDFPTNARAWDLHVTGDSLWIATFDNGLFLFYNDSIKSFKNEITTQKVTWITIGKNDVVWIGTFGDGLYQFKNNKIKHWNKSNSNLSDNRIYSVVPDLKGNLWIGTKGGVNHFDLTAEKFTAYTTKDGLPNGTVMGIIHGKKSDIWLSTNRGICHFFPQKDSAINYDINDGLQSNEFLIHSFIELSTGEMLFGGINGFNVFPFKGLSANRYPPQVVLADFEVAEGDWNKDSSITIKTVINLEHYQNEFSFEFTALSYTDPLKNKYSYIMQGYDKTWKMNGTRRFVQYTNLPPGKYVFKVKAANNDGVWNETPAKINLIIHPAFWQTLLFRIIVGVSFIIILVLIYRVRVRQITKKNLWLEREVAIRTKEIEEKNLMIKEAFDEIKSSIQYAKRIQNAILPPNKMVKKYLKDSFILYKPKDIVAGDFYWLEFASNSTSLRSTKQSVKKSEIASLHKSFVRNDVVLFAAADCTGHGVPGAMVSVVCNNALNRSVREYGLIEPGEILDKTREIVIQEFEKSEEEVKDGMDIALCSLSYTSPLEGRLRGVTLQYAGANNPLWVVRPSRHTELVSSSTNKDTLKQIQYNDYVLYEVKANKQPIGKFDNPLPYTTHTFELQKEDTIYIFSDGFVDQFGGEKGKKFKAKAFRELILSIQDKVMEEQKRMIDETFEKWRGSLEQIDDVCVIGVRI